MIKIFILIYLLILNIGNLFANDNIKFVTFYNQTSSKTLKLLHIKDNEAKRVGLMNKEQIEPFDGLLFEFSKDEDSSMWMKNMLISIDMIFLSKDAKFLGAIENAMPCKKDEKCSIYSMTNTMYVIETKAGFINKNSIKNSNKIEINSYE